MDNVVLTAEIGRILRKYRRSKKISKAKMSKLSGVSEMAIVNLELGQHNSNMTTILKVMQALGLKFNIYQADEWQPLDADIEYQEQGWGMALGNYKEVMQSKKAKKLAAEQAKIEAAKLKAEDDEDVSEDDFFGPGKGLKKKDPHDIDTTGEEEMPVF
jgi:transcriptional regulator with XRE-family HTH domain